MTPITLAVLFAASSIFSSPFATSTHLTQRPSTSVAQCTSYSIPLRISSSNLVFNITRFKNNFDVVDLVTDLARKDSSVVFHPVSRVENATAEYTINGTFCSPKKLLGKGRERTVLLATHGIGYDGRYWDSAYKPEEYSFVQAMVKEGYSVFSYDRLGTGKSEKISGYTNQASIQTEILANIATVLRNGTYTGAIGTPSSIVLVGHSFGSYTSNRVLTKYPTLIDAAILTGYVFPGDALSVQIFVEGTAPRIASHVSPHAFSHLDTGYLTFGDIFAHVNTFFKAPAYELDAVEYAHSIAQPYGIAELLSFGQDSVVAPAFAGPVLVTTGEYDFAMCRGECYSSFAGQRLESVFPKSRVLEAFVQPGAGHGVNFARNASGFYEGIGGFLGRAGF